MNDQRSVTDQLRDAVQLCNERGLYDAADAIQRRLFGSAGLRQILVTDPEDIERLKALRVRIARDRRECDPGSPETHCGASDCTDHGCQEA